MRNSKFAEAYLNIIKEENEQFAMNVAPEAPIAPVPTEAGTEEGDKGEQIVCFKTSDKSLIDAINSGFEEAVFFVKAKDEATGEDTVTEIKFGADAFKDFEVKPCECDKGESCPECGEAPCTCEDGEEITTECGDAEAGGEVTEEGEEVATEEGDGAEVTEEDEMAEEEIDPSEWLEDGVCVKCGKADCDGSCKCAKCGSQNCIGDCEGAEVATECGDAVATEEDEGGDAGDAGDAGGDI